MFDEVNLFCKKISDKLEIQSKQKRISAQVGLRAIRLKKLIINYQLSFIYYKKQ